MMFYVYVLQCEQAPDQFYLGATGDLKRRLREHNQPHKGFTTGHLWRLVYYEAYLSKAAAFDRERRLKRNARMRQFLLDRVQASLEG